MRIRTVRAIDRATDFVIGLALCVMLLIGLYSLWDSNQVYHAADAGNYVAYRPSADETKSFEQLRQINPEVFAWLTVNDTPIDYPVTQADNNEKYINTNAEGQYTLSGAIFLDYRNSPDFDDFNSILYGHHMEKKRMFGSLSDFAEETYFDAHPYGNLFFNGQDHGLEFFAFLLTDAYDQNLFSPAVVAEEKKSALLAEIYAAALYTRDIPVTTEDHLILLSTCTNSITNGRYMLVGRLSEELHLQEQTAPAPVIRLGTGIDRPFKIFTGISVWFWLAALAMLCALLVVVKGDSGRKKPGKSLNKGRMRHEVI